MAPRAPPKFHSIRVLATDFAASWTFYRDTIGLTPRDGHGQPPYGEFVDRRGKAFLAVFDRQLMADAVRLSASRIPAASVGRSLVALEVEDVDRWAERLRRRGVRFLAGPKDRVDWGLRTVHLRDPDGHVVEVYSPLTRR